MRESSQIYSPREFVPGRVQAIANIVGSTVYAPTLRGRVDFAPYRDGTLITVNIMGLPQSRPKTNITPQIGPFGLHIHEGKKCGNYMGKEPFTEAGAHWMSPNQLHPFHTGDLPSLLPSKSGNAFVQVYSDRFRPSDAVGHTVVIHLSPDDYMTQPAGNAGIRIGCGEITAVQYL